MSISRYIKEIGRGKDGARSLGEADAFALMDAILSGRASDLEIGAAVLALRMKGESVEELVGFLRAAHAHCALFTHDKPVVLIPTYNGARKLPNLVPLLALLLAREGVAVLVHGLTHDAARVTTHAIFQALGLPVIMQREALPQVKSAWQMGEPAFVSLAAISPALGRLLAVRQVVGVRNSAHTLVKLLRPFTAESAPSVRLSNYTHPEYAAAMTALLLADEAANTLLMRGTEGEAVADARRSQCIEWFSGGEKRELVSAQQGVVASLPLLPREIDAVSTATYIQRVLSGEHPVPEPIARQSDAVLQCVAQIVDTGNRKSLIPHNLYGQSLRY